MARPELAQRSSSRPSPSPPKEEREGTRRCSPAAAAAGPRDLARSPAQRAGEEEGCRPAPRELRSVGAAGPRSRGGPDAPAPLREEGGGGRGGRHGHLTSPLPGDGGDGGGREMGKGGRSAGRALWREPEPGSSRAQGRRSGGRSSRATPPRRARRPKPEREGGGRERERERGGRRRGALDEPWGRAASSSVRVEPRRALPPPRVEGAGEGAACRRGEQGRRTRERERGERERTPTG